MQTFYIFSTKTGNYIGTRGIAPEPESDEIGILQTPETLAQLTACLVPKLSSGQIIEGATPEQIVEAQKEPVPTQVALWQLRFILEQTGLEQAVSDAIEQLPEPKRSAGKKIWDFGNTVERESPTVELIKHALNLTNEQADEIFINAKKVKL
jgi:hypothetical protein